MATVYYTNTLQTTTSGFTPYFTSGYAFSTGALTSGGAWYDPSNPSGLHGSGFLVGISEDSSKLKNFLETADLSSITFSDIDYIDTGKFIIGAQDLRGTGDGLSGFGGAEGSASLTAATDYRKRLCWWILYRNCYNSRRKYQYPPYI